jgi:hypothetical protein
MSFTATATVLNPSGNRQKYSSGQNPTRAAAKAELVAELKLISAQVLLSVSISENVGTTELADFVVGHAATAAFEDATLSLHRVGGTGEPPFVYREKRIENMALAYKVTSSDQVDMTATDVAAFVTAFYDGTGHNGYAENIGKSTYDS